MFQKVEDLAYGRWPYLFQAKGIDAKFFTARNGPCPICGGRDRYRWVQKKAGGLWVCNSNSCTEGKYASPVKLLMLHMGFLDFESAADEVRAFFAGHHGASVQKTFAPATVQNDAQVQKKNLARVMEVWEQAVPIRAGDPVDRYLRARVAGLQLDLQNIRYHAALPYWESPASLGGRYELKGHFPSMVALLHAPDGSVAQLHKTYLSEHGTKAAVPSAKKMMPSTGLNSFALRMQDVPGNVLGICEGIETACAAAMLRKIPVWPCLNGGTMARFELPNHLRGQVKKLVIFEDHDPFKPVGKVQANGARQAEQPGALYARDAADRALQAGLRPLIITSAMVGQDMADYWQQQQAA